METLLIIALLATGIALLILDSMRLPREDAYLHYFDFELMSDRQLTLFATNKNIDQRLKVKAVQVLEERKNK